MLKFKELELIDIPIITKYFNAFPQRICDKSVGCIIMWRSYYNNCFVVENDTLFLKSLYPSGEGCFTFPIGNNIDEAFTSLIEFCKYHQRPLILCVITEPQLAFLNEHFKVKKVETDRNWYDYYYESQTLLNLAGRKYAGQRNHINKFNGLYPNFTFEKITKEDIPQILEFLVNYQFNSKKQDDNATKEKDMDYEYMQNYHIYGGIGGVLKVDQKIVGFSVGEIINDTLFIHIEKADIEYEGAYPMLINQYLKKFLTDSVKYVNREDDMGDLGLRKSKLSYHPIELIKKYRVEIEI